MIFNKSSQELCINHKLKLLKKISVNFPLKKKTDKAKQYVNVKRCPWVREQIKTNMQTTVERVEKTQENNTLKFTKKYFSCRLTCRARAAEIGEMNDHNQNAIDFPK